MIGCIPADKFVSINQNFCRCLRTIKDLTSLMCALATFAQDGHHAKDVYTRPLYYHRGCQLHADTVRGKRYVSASGNNFLYSPLVNHFHRESDWSELNKESENRHGQQHKIA